MSNYIERYMKDNMFFKKEKTSKTKLLLSIIIIAFVLVVCLTENDIKANFVKQIKDNIENSENNNEKQVEIKKMYDDQFKNLPTWNLTDLYDSLEDERIDLDLEELNRMVNDFQKYKGKIKDLSGKELYEAVIEYENIQELMAKLASYSYLKYSEDTSLDANLKFYQKIKEELNNLYTETLFFPLELNKISDSRMQQLYKESRSLSVYKQVIEDIRVEKSHQLSEDLEKMSLDKSLTGNDAWVRLYDELMNNTEFEYNGQKYNQAQFLTLMNGKDEKVRAETSKIFGETLAKNGKIITLITNTLAKDKEISDRWRKFKTPISARNLSNLIDDDVVNSLRETVKKNYADTAHRYYKWKAKELGKEKLDYYDRNAPLPYDDDKVYTWEEAKEIVLSSYNDFSPQMAIIAQEFIDNNWIDVPTRPGKMSGGYMMPTTPKVHPYILLNYQGRSEDVSTLAHELGHGIHQTLADKNGYLMSRTPLTLAETASVFGEQLTFRKILNQETDPQKKKAILASKIEDMLNTVVRQIAFLEFELKVHNERKNGELTMDRINEIWLETQKESLGEDVFNFNDEYKYYWMYIPHFIHSPFYVYSYAFGDCLVNSLYGIYLEQPDGFEEKYITLLQAGSTKRYDELLKPFNLDPKDPEFWQNGLNVISGFIDELEAMDQIPNNQ